MTRYNSSKRTDIHRPAAIIPADYQAIAFLPHGHSECAYRIAQMKHIQEHMTKTGGAWSHHEHGGSCDICGNVQAMTHVVFYHEKSNAYIRAGSICAEKVEMDFDRNAFTNFVKCAADARARKAGIQKAQITLQDADLSRSFEVFQKLDAGGDAWAKALRAEVIIHDIVGKLIKYGSLSPAQLNFMRKLESDIDNQAQILAQREAEKLTLNEVPSGRIQITGTILCTKEVENDFGCCTKMLVMDDRNFKVWGTMPSCMNAAKGDKVQFFAAVTPKAGERGFGFYSRPTKAVNLSAPVQELVIG